MRLLYTWLAIVQFGWVNLRRNRVTTGVSSSIIMAVLWLMAGWLQVGHWLETWLQPYREQFVVYVYLRDDVTPSQQARIEERLHRHPLVVAYERVSAEEARRRFLDMFPEMQGVVESLETNPLPPHYEVRLNPTHLQPHLLRELARVLEQTPGVTSVDYQQQWVERLALLFRIVRWGGLALGLILAFMALFTVANVIRLSFYTRREEVQILRLLGAHPWHVRLPFYIEGFMLGLLGSGMAVVLSYLTLVGGRWYLRRLLAAFGVVGVNLPTFCPAFGGILVGGIALGLLGAVIALWMMRTEGTLNP